MGIVPLPKGRNGEGSVLPLLVNEDKPRIGNGFIKKVISASFLPENVRSGKEATLNS